MKYDINWLIQQQKDNKPLKFIHFWGHQPTKDGSIGTTCLSQWWIQPFKINNIIYPTAEHWMMAEKARLFKDKDVENEILKAQSPAEAKSLGRKVRNFDEKIWNAHRFEIVCKGNFHKFSQHENLKIFLMNTGERIIVEASPIDAIWGNGHAKDHPYTFNAEKWRGLNLLGFALMNARDKLKQL
jgi:ribA/ribD-fused uncharacterized protein